MLSVITERFMKFSVMTGVLTENFSAFLVLISDMTEKYMYRFFQQQFRQFISLSLILALPIRNLLVSKT